MSFHKPTRRRATRREVLEKRAAMAVLEPVVKALPRWQQRAAMLSSMARRSVEKPGSHTRAEDAAALAEEIELQRQQLASSLSESPGVASHSRVIDVLRALDSVAAVARQARLHPGRVDDSSQRAEAEAVPGSSTTA